MATSSFPAGCLGKLPHVADFIKYNASSREMVVLDQWLQQGLVAGKNQLGEKWEPVYQNGPSYNFLFYAENAQRFLLGVLQPSQDKIGRKYPFIVSVLVERARLGEQLVPIAPALFASFFAQARQLLLETGRGLDTREIAGRIESLAVPYPGALDQQPRHHQDHLAAATSESFWRGLFGDFEDAKKYLLFKNLTEILLPLRGREPGKLALGLRFPLLNDGNTLGDGVAFWLQVTQQLLRNPGFLPFMFWTAPEINKNAHLFLFFRTPAARVFAQLMQPELPSDNVCELEEEGKDKMSGAEQALLAAYRSLLQRKESTLKEFLQKL